MECKVAHVGAILLTSLVFAACSGASEEGAPEAAGSAVNVAKGRPKDIKATHDPRYKTLESTWAIRPVKGAAKDTTLAVFETGTGDPSANGNHLILKALGSTGGSVFDLGLQMAHLNTAEITSAGSIHLVGDTATSGEMGELGFRPWEATVKIALKGGEFEPKVNVSSDGKASDVIASKDASIDFLRNVDGMLIQQIPGGATARVFETVDATASIIRGPSPGPPSINRIGMILTLTGGQKSISFDLGQTLSSVTKLEPVIPAPGTIGPTEFTIGGAEDAPEAKGTPVVLSAKFSSMNGVPQEPVKLARR